ncbi:MAG: insulinase family protein [Trueperaceae bacterium]|nr:insulinase family protein [Trueperaceae bacterium]
MSFQKTVLDNGLTIIGEHNPHAQSFAAGYFVNTGSRDETPELAGVSHFLEHMLFKGSDKRSAEDINREFDELGANNNAYTNEERTVYHATVVAERGEAMLELLTDMMRPVLRQSDFDMEKKVILEEIAMYEDRPNFKVFELGNAQFFDHHPLGNSVLGSNESISALSREQMQAYFDKRYAPNNMVLSLSGNYDWQAMLNLVNELSQSWKAQVTERRFPGFKPSLGEMTRQDEKLKRAHVAFYAPGLSAQDEARYAAFLLSNCIGDSSGSRLYWALLDKGLVDNAYFYHDSNDGLGVYQGYLSAEPERLAEVTRIFIDTLLDVETNGLLAEEWERAQRKLATSLTLRAETPYGRLMSLGPNFLYGNDYQSVDELVEKIFATRLESALELLARKPFSNLFTYTLTP